MVDDNDVGVGVIENVGDIFRFESVIGSYDMELTSPKVMASSGRGDTYRR